MLKRLLSVLIICLSLVFLVYSRVVPVSKIWKGYTVLYADVAIAENTVLDILSKYGISGVISMREHGKALETMAPARFESENALSMDYPEEVKKYFFDENKRFELYYIPDDFRGELSSALSSLLAFGTCGIDESFSYPFLVPVVCFLFFVCLLFSAESRLSFVLFSIFPLAFAICVPNSINGAASCLLLYGCFLLQKLYQKPNAIFPGFHNVFLLLSIFAPVLICFSVSPKNALLCAVAAIGLLSCAVMILHFDGKSPKGFARNFRVGSSSFSPISIISSPYEVVITREVADCLFLCAGAILLQIVFSLFPLGHFSSGMSVSGLALPSPTASQEEEYLPDLNDYLNWSWNLVTFQYRPLWASVNDSASTFKEGDVVEVPFYGMDGSKVVKRSSKQFVYGQQFLKEMLSSIKDEGQNRIELLLASQGENARFSYSSSSGEVERVNQISLVILFGTVCIPLGMALYYIHRRRKQYANSI